MTYSLSAHNTALAASFEGVVNEIKDIYWGWKAYNSRLAYSSLNPIYAR